MRAVLVLRYERNWALPDLATRFGVSKHVVTRRVRDALTRLRERYEKATEEVGT